MRKGEEEDDIFGEKFTDEPETSKDLSKIQSSARSIAALIDSDGFVKD